MNVEILFWAVFIIFGSYALFVIFSKRGRNFSINKFIGTIIKDYGVVSEDRIFGSKQKIRLLKCKKNEETFYVLETEFTAFLSLQFYYTKISALTANKLINLLSENKTESNTNF